MEKAGDRDMELVFRVVEDGGIRRGIRLEAIYWQVLRQIADLRRKKIGALVAAILADAPQPVNTTAFLRAYCLRFTLDALATEREITDPSGVGNLVRASPGPTFALGPDKRLIAYNQSFLNYIQARLTSEETQLAQYNLRLTLDVQLVDLTARLRSAGNRPLEVGFVVSLGGRRLHGKLNALLAPAAGRHIVLCYVLA